MISYLYLAIFAAISYFLPLSDRIKSLIAQPALLMIPYLVGKPLFYFVRKLLSLKEENDFAFDALITWLLGIVFMVVLEAALYVNYMFELNSFVLILLVIGLPSIFIREKANLSHLRQKEISVALTYGFIFSLLVTRFWPYPYSNDNDIFTHTFYVTRIVIQNRPLLFYTDYLPTMHTIYAVMMRVFNVSPNKEPIYLLWASRFILYPVYSVGLYLFAQQFSRNRLLSLLTATLGVSLLSMMNGAMFPYHTAPKNFIDLLIIYGLYATTYQYQKSNEQIKIFPSIIGLGILAVLIFVPLYLTRVTGTIGYEIGFILPLLLTIVLLVPRFLSYKYRDFFLSIAIVIAGLVFIAKLQGLQAAVIILAYVFFTWISGKLRPRAMQAVVIFCGGVTLAVFFLIQLKIVPYATRAILLPDPTGAGFWGWQSLVDYVRYIYPSILLFLFGAGCVFALFSARDEHMYRTPVIIAAISLFAYFMPITMSSRFLGDAHPFIMLLGSYAVIKLLQINETSLRQNNAILPLLLMTAFIGVNICANDVNIFLNGEPNIWNKDTFQVINVGEFIKNHIDKNAIIIQSQFYQQLQAFYGGVDVTYLWKGGIYYDSYVMDIYNADTAEDAYGRAKTLMSVQEQVVRVADKDGRDIDRFYRPPSDVFLLCDDALMWSKFGENKTAKFFDTRYFEVVFTSKNSNNSNFFVIRVKPEPALESLPNLVKNPSFEEGIDPITKYPLSWKQASDSRWTGSIDSEIKAKGNYSYRMQTGVADARVWGDLRSDVVPVESGKEYIFAVKGKTENSLKTVIGLYYLEKSSGKWLPISVFSDIETTQDWKVYTKIIKIPDGITEVDIILSTGWVNDKDEGMATSWFDDIEIIGPVEITSPG